MGQQLEREQQPVQGQLQRDQGGPVGAHVECQGHQLGEEAAVPGLANQGAEARLCYAQRDQADLATVLGRLPQPLDAAEKVRGLHHLHKPEEPPEGQGVGHLCKLDQGTYGW